MTQYLQCRFHGSDRAYCYAYDGEEKIAPDDKVEVTTAKGDQIVTVVSVSRDEPPFATKQIKRVLTTKEPVEAENANDA